MRVTDRDQRIIDLVFHARALRCDQIHIALFPRGSDSRCQRRLTLLVRHRYLDRLPRMSVNAPAVYVLTRHSIQGNRLMRARYGDTEFRKHMIRIGFLPHLLAINDLRIRVARACQELGWTLIRWDRSEDLAMILKDKGLVPDAYFQIRRVVNGVERTSGFFLELQRAVKTQRILESKLERYLALYQKHRYEALFGIPGMRVLVVFTDALGGPGQLRAQRGAELAERIAAAPAHFASLAEVASFPPVACVLRPFWRAPGHAEPVPLFDLPQAGQS